MTVKTHILIMAAGKSNRFDASIPKQFHKLKTPYHGHDFVVTLAMGALQKALGSAAMGASQGVTVIALPAQTDLDYFHIMLQLEDEVLCHGGETRSESVLLGLEKLVSESTCQPDDWVLIHDGSRPCVSVKDIQRLHTVITKQEQQKPLENRRGGALAIPVTDTLRSTQSTSNAHIRTADETINREEIWQTLTPQMFPVSTIKTAVELAVASDAMHTDEVEAFSAIHKQSLLVEGMRNNIKITYKEDIPMAQYILESQKPALTNNK